MSGQQSNYVSRGGNPTNNKWSLDGVDITDMSATGASPAYYDFDSFQEMTINTGGVDVTQQTGGVGINLVTKSGTDKFRGSSRFFLTDESVQANNISDDLRRQGATSGNPIQNIKDNYPDVPTEEFDLYSACVDALINGTVDAVTTDQAILIGYAALYPNDVKVVGEPFSEENYGVGLRKGDDVLRAHINDLFTEGGDTWKAIFDKNLGESGITVEQPAVDAY